MPSLRIGGTSGIVLLLYMIAIFGALHLLALSAPNSRLAKSWLGLGF